MKDEFVTTSEKSVHGLFWTLLGLFLPVPLGGVTDNPVFRLFGYKFVYTLSFHSSRYKKLQIPFGWIIILVSYVMCLLTK